MMLIIIVAEKIVRKKEKKLAKVFHICYYVLVCVKHSVFCALKQSGRRNFDLQLTTSRTQGGMSRGKKSRKTS